MHRRHLDACAAARLGSSCRWPRSAP